MKLGVGKLLGWYSHNLNIKKKKKMGPYAMTESRDDTIKLAQGSSMWAGSRSRHRR